MAVSVEQVEGTEKTIRVTIDDFRLGRITNSFPHKIPDEALYVADNVVYNFDALVSKRPGNAYYGFGGGGNGQTGSGVRSLSGVRFYPGPVGTTTPKLLVQSGGHLSQGNDGTGAFNSINAAMSVGTPATYAQMRDPDMTTGNAVALFICDGSRIPQVYDGANFVPVQTGVYAASGAIPGGNYLPNGVRTGTPIKPKFCLNWQNHMVYAGDDDDPTGLWISDADRPERFNGFSLTDSGGITYTPYYPGGQDGDFGPITGLSQCGPFLVIRFFGGIVSAINTGTYGALQYQFATISSSTGCPSPYSWVDFEGYSIFFGGDDFYACNGEMVVPMPHMIPDVYGNGNSNSVFPPDMKNKTTVIGMRRGTQYIASYDNVGAGSQTVPVMFDTAANQGYSFGAQSGGAWARWPTGMPMAWGVECRGAGDAFQFFWGSSLTDTIAQHDVGTYDDFGAPIAIEIRAKAITLEKMAYKKKCIGLYIIAVFQTEVAEYTDTLTGYIVTSLGLSVAPPVSADIAPTGVPYGSQTYGSFQYEAGSQILQGSLKSYPPVENDGNAIQPGVIESSTNPFNLIGFVIDLIMDSPIP